jgi:hypothetical protein
MILLRHWIITTPDQREHRVVAVNVPQAVDFVAGALGRSVRLTPRHLGEVGETWLCALVDSPDGHRAAPTVYTNEAA